MHLQARRYQGGQGKIVVILLSLILLLVLGLGGLFAYTQGLIPGFAPEEDDEDQELVESEPETPEAYYQEFEESITVSIRTEGGRSAVFQAQVQFMAYQEEAFDEIERHTPAIRNALISLFSDMYREDFEGSENIAQVREQALTAVNDVLDDKGASHQVRELYFSDYVTQ